MPEGSITVQEKVVRHIPPVKKSTVDMQGGGGEGRAGFGRSRAPGPPRVLQQMSVASTHGTRQLVEDEKQTPRKFFVRERLGTSGDRKRPRKF